MSEAFFFFMTLMTASRITAMFFLASAALSSFSTRIEIFRRAYCVLAGSSVERLTTNFGTLTSFSSSESLPVPALRLPEELACSVLGARKCVARTVPPTLPQIVKITIKGIRIPHFGPFLTSVSSIAAGFFAFAFGASFLLSIFTQLSIVF